MLQIFNIKISANLTYVFANYIMKLLHSSNISLQTFLEQHFRQVSEKIPHPRPQSKPGRNSGRQSKVAAKSVGSSSELGNRPNDKAPTPTTRGGSSAGRAPVCFERKNLPGVSEFSPLFTGGSIVGVSTKSRQNQTVENAGGACNNYHPRLLDSRTTDLIADDLLWNVKQSFHKRNLLI